MGGRGSLADRGACDPGRDETTDEVSSGGHSFGFIRCLRAGARREALLANQIRLDGCFVCFFFFLDELFRFGCRNNLSINREEDEWVESFYDLESNDDLTNQLYCYVDFRRFLLKRFSYKRAETNGPKGLHAETNMPCQCHRANFTHWLAKPALFQSGH